MQRLYIKQQNLSLFRLKSKKYFNLGITDYFLEKSSLERNIY